MKNLNPPRKIAIIGCGPRGLSALESLFHEAAVTNPPVEALVFERTSFPGAGHVYDLDQNDSNWLNVSIRTIDIGPREETVFPDFTIPRFPTYQDWTGFNESNDAGAVPDMFPLRSKLGRYLMERYESIAYILNKHGLMTYVNDYVQKVVPENGSISIVTLSGERYVADEAVLTIGHQPIELDEQLNSWNNNIDEHRKPSLFLEPYPVADILEKVKADTSPSVGIRGFGLAMIDVVRALSSGLGGQYKIINRDSREMEYAPSGMEPCSIVPFSLDGLPMAPKPLNQKMDDGFVPATSDMHSYENFINAAINGRERPKSTQFLIDAIVPIIAKIYTSASFDTPSNIFEQEELFAPISNWLQDDNHEHPLVLSQECTARDTMERFILMASGQGAVSLDYCIGQVWRHCQPTMYKLLSFAPLSNEVIEDIVALDERLKRYSYGPPMESIQQLLALNRAGILSFEFVKDPEIELKETGWTLVNGKRSHTVDIMVNSVLAAPEILKVVSPLPRNLIDSPIAEPLHDALGVRTKKNATLDVKGKFSERPIAVLGRLAKGTLIGVDAIAECFGIRSELWAKGVMERIAEQNL